ncbi:MAG TPA: 2-C-methyl-D-erythritol 2,4-cyclodiphosphate synthase [Balneolaceae bacterium]|nr:2-C-methyl-D-erythritol 2,4-cyclodiphosphate synthase [Balneolaceae bacterium]
MKDIRVGSGYDVHQLVEGRPLILGGVHIDYSKGLSGHSDADVLLHTIIDALFGAVALGDIGSHFPDDEEEFKNIDSRKLLIETAKKIRNREWKIGNIDATIVAQEPRLAAYIDQMRDNIANDLDIAKDHISVKATTSEELGFEGEKKGISARTSVLVYK